jgi:hypothetical protein
MRFRPLAFAIVFGLGVILPDVALAGMPSPVLSDWATVRFETISFFVVLLLVFAAVIRWLWNYLAKDFAWMPRLTYGKTLAMVVLVGTMLAVVLTMIAGARELLTPGAWRKEGLLYKVKPNETKNEAHEASPPAPQRADDRRAHLQNLQAALWQYAAKHAGRLPDNDRPADIAAELWELPGFFGVRYLYVAGLRTGDSRQIVAYEPNVYGDQRFVLRANGEVALLSSADIRKELSEKPR